MVPIRHVPARESATRISDGLGGGGSADGWAGFEVAANLAVAHACLAAVAADTVCRLRAGERRRFAAARALRP